MKSNISYIALALAAVAIVMVLVGNQSSQSIGAPSGPAHYQTESFLQGLTAGGRDQFTVSNTGVMNMVRSTEVVTGANTLTAAESGKTTFISTTGATYTLPPVTTAGLVYRFSVSAAFSTNAVVASAEGDNIEGAIIVAGAVVTCDAVDQINFVADGENLGDFVELESDGTSWHIGASGALTSEKMTCTDPA